MNESNQSINLFSGCTIGDPTLPPQVHLASPTDCQYQLVVKESQGAEV
jgi:hypothetical protein